MTTIVKRPCAKCNGTGDMGDHHGMVLRRRAEDALRMAEEIQFDSDEVRNATIHDARALLLDILIKTTCDACKGAGK